MLQVAFASPTLPAEGALVLPIAEGASPAGLWQQADEATNGAISRAFSAASFKGVKGKTCTILAPGQGLTRVVAVGLGKEVTTRVLEEAGGHAAAALGEEVQAAIATDGLDAAQAIALASGAVLRSYRFDRYRTKEKPEEKPKLASLRLMTADPGSAETAWASFKPVAEGVFLTRDLVAEPANVLTPVAMAERCEALGKL
ncbi:MAG: leucyl aminopeptidase, partial [Acetobacteraceae bacterium]|nr:leucyl aminopeptidase [Acetobacteraceae bacterium]